MSSLSQAPRKRLPTQPALVIIPLHLIFNYFLTKDLVRLSPGRSRCQSVTFQAQIHEPARTRQRLGSAVMAVDAALNDPKQNEEHKQMVEVEEKA